MNDVEVSSSSLMSCMDPIDAIVSPSRPRPVTIVELLKSLGESPLRSTMCS